MLGAHELLVDGMVEEFKQRAVKVGHIQQSTRFALQAELRPGQDFSELLQGALPAGQGDKAVGQLRHERLALVHRTRDT